MKTKTKYGRLNRCGTIVELARVDGLHKRDFIPILEKSVVKVPKGAEFFRGGMFYKKGIHEKVFIWLNEWKVSSREWSYVKLGKWVSFDDFLEIKE